MSKKRKKITKSKTKKSKKPPKMSSSAKLRFKILEKAYDHYNRTYGLEYYSVVALYRDLGRIADNVRLQPHILDLTDMGFLIYKELGDPNNPFTIVAIKITRDGRERVDEIRETGVNI